MSVMELPFESRRHSSPPDRPIHRRSSSLSAAAALQFVSRQHRAVAGHTLQPLSAYSILPRPELFDIQDVPSPFMPGCCVLMSILSYSTYFSAFFLPPSM
jgi:hypothetical protein